MAWNIGSTSNSRNEPFGSRPEPDIQMTRTIHLLIYGEVPEGRAGADFQPTCLCASRTLEARAGTGRYLKRPPLLVDTEQSKLPLPTI